MVVVDLVQLIQLTTGVLIISYFLKLMTKKKTVTKTYDVHVIPETEEFNYTVIVSDGVKEVTTLSRTKSSLIVIYPVGYMFCGQNYKGKRPTKVVKLYKELKDQRLIEWERECLAPIGNERTEFI